MYLYDHKYSDGRQGTGVAIGAIDGPDTSQRVKNTSEAPYRWICALDVYFSSGLVKGTGLLISPRHVLTTAQNLNKTMIATGGPPVEAQKVIVTPGLDGAKLLGKQRTPVGSIELKPGDWWIPNQYLTLGVLEWNVAVLTLPRELPLLQGMTYGHWSDGRFNPRTTIVATTAASLGGATVSVSGYPADKGGASTQWEVFAKVQPGFVGVESVGAMVYDVEASTGTLGGAPVWQKDGGLRLVAIHLFDDAKLSNPKTYQPEVHSVALVMRAEIVDALRQRIVIERIPPTF